jgi:hypothetical protein
LIDPCIKSGWYQAADDDFAILNAALKMTQNIHQPSPGSLSRDICARMETQPSPGPDSKLHGGLRLEGIP